MSENAPETPAATKPSEAEAKPEAPAQETDWKAEARKWETRAKENSKAAERLAEIEEATKTAEQKAAERLAAAEKRAAELEDKANRAEVAAEKGLAAKYAKFLTGTTREELEASADELIELQGDSSRAPVIRGQEKAPSKTPSSAEAEFARSLFGN